MPKSKITPEIAKSSKEAKNQKGKKPTRLTITIQKREAIKRQKK